jgi:hypothetical protein
MRLGLLGSFFQIESCREGYVLWRAGLLDVRRDGWWVEIQPIDLLRSLFAAMPELEAVYPVRVECVMIYRYLSFPGFLDAEATARRLGELGMTAEGLERLRELLGVLSHGC